MTTRPRLSALGTLGALAFAPTALADDKAPVEMSFVTEPSAEGLVVRMYARNTGTTVVKVDDNPGVRSAAVRAADGTLTEVQVLPQIEMMSRGGPRRSWMAVQPGEKLLVGSATLLFEDQVPTGGLELSVSVRTPEASTVVKQTIPVREPGT